MESADHQVQLFAQPRKKSGKRKHLEQHKDEAHQRKHSKKESTVQQQQQQLDEGQQQEQKQDGQVPESSSNPPSTSGRSDDTFHDLGVSDWLCSVLNSLGIKRPTQVQVGCIPAVLAGRNVIGTAQTGSGKTAAFALPILQHLAKDPYGVFALVLTPTRELAMQLADQFRAFGAGMSLRITTVIGGMEQQQQAQAVKRKPHVVVATPGRLAALLETDSSLAAGFSRIKYLVMDEADRLLDASFESDLRLLLGVLPDPSERQTLLFSATLTASLVKLQRAAMEDAHVFQAYEGLQTADKLTEQYIFIPHKVKDVYLHHLLTTCITALQQQQQPAAGSSGGGSGGSSGGGGLPAGLGSGARSAIVFVSTCKGCRVLDQVLRELGIPAASLHSGKSQKQRLAALHAFKSESVSLLLATDVASRGLDIPSVDLVVNYDLPRLAADYVHRVGRTARAGRAGWSLSFITQYDVELVAAIEGHIGHKLSEYSLDESSVLKGISRVYGAKKAAALALLAQEDKAAVGQAGGRQRSKK